MRLHFRTLFIALLILGTIAPLFAQRKKGLTFDELEKHEWFKAYASFDLESAKELLETHLEDNPTEMPTVSYYAEVLRRLNYFQEADSVATVAIDLDKRHGFAWCIRGDIRNPQYNIKSDEMFSDYETWFEYYLKGAKYDKHNGNLGEVIWGEAMRLQDSELAYKALGMMYHSNHFTPFAFAYARLLLKYLPENALFVTGGDMDTYPLEVIQKYENYRSDVVIMNISLLNTKWYLPYLIQNRNIDVGMSTETIQSQEFTYNEQTGGVDLIATKLLDSMVTAIDKGILTRPLCITSSYCGPLVRTKTSSQIPVAVVENYEYCGPYSVYRGKANGVELNSALVLKIADELNPHEFVGPFISKTESSPLMLQYRYKRATDKSISSIFVPIIEDYIESGDIEGADELIAVVYTYLDVVGNHEAKEGYERYFTFLKSSVSTTEKEISSNDKTSSEEEQDLSSQSHQEQQ